MSTSSNELGASRAASVRRQLLQVSSCALGHRGIRTDTDRRNQHVDRGALSASLLRVGNV
jgi:hypothetical protein